MSSRSVEFLSQDQILEQDFDLTYQDYETEESQDESDMDDLGTGRTAEMFGIAEPVDEQLLKQNMEALQLQCRNDDAEYAASMQLSIYGGNNEVDMDSDEEASIIREIKAEITAQVRSEMHDELVVYKEAREKLKTPTDQLDNDNDNMDPQLKEAIIKMKKLDKILNKKIKREKEVKRDRIMLQKRLKEELENLKSEGRDEIDKVKNNTEKFLALTLPPSHNAGVSIESEYTEEDDRDCITPLFQTQISEEALNRRGPQTSSKSSKGDVQRSARSASTENSLDSQSLHSDATSSKTTDSKGNKKKKKDFIERNIQLSSDAGNAIAMTDDEKERIEDLLKDIDALPEIQEDGESVQDENPYQIAIPLGEGYLPTPEQMTRLEDIDSRLRMLLPPEDYESIASNTPRKIASHEFQMDLFSRTGFLDMDSDHGHPGSHEAHPGETALLQVKEQRDFKFRLKEIEEELASLSSVVELEIESPSLSSHQLQELLDECSRTMSRVTAETSTISQSTHRSDDSTQRSLISVTPLSNDVLQKLLADARQELMGRTSPAGSEQEGTFITKDDLVLESISEETLRDLLRDTRTTSRYGSRPSSGHHSRASSNGGYSYPLRNNGDDREMDSFSNGRSDNRRQPFLPEIDPRGQLSTQKLNGGFLENGLTDSMPSRPGGSNRLAFAARSGEEEEDSNESSPTPHPPTSGRRASSSGRRTVSPLIKSLAD